MLQHVTGGSPRSRTVRLLDPVLIQSWQCQIPGPAAMTDTRSAAQIFADIFGPAPTERERSLIVRVTLPCERSIIALRSANLAERTGQKIVLQRQLSDLGMEHRQ